MELVPVNSLILKTEDPVENEDSEVKLTEKEKRRLDILLQEETPELHVDPSILHRLNHIDRELNVLRGERSKESVNTRNETSDEEDEAEISDEGWTQTQTRLDKIEKTLESMQQERSSNQRQRLLPLREQKTHHNNFTEMSGISEEGRPENEQ